MLEVIAEISIAKPDLGFPRPCHRFPSLFVRSPAALGLALIPLLFSLCQRQFDLHPPVFEVQPGRDERQTLLLRFPNQLSDFLFMDQQLARPQSLVIAVTAMVVRAYVCI